MDLANDDILAKDKNGVKKIQVREDLFIRKVETKRMKTKDSKKTVRAFLTKFTKKMDPKDMDGQGCKICWSV